jgi:CRISPR-associated protein Cmr2
MSRPTTCHGMECDMTEQYFFTCSIGPVQGFVATARTSQDLWFGSWMLSELAKAAAKALKDGGHTLIFPAPESDLHPDSAVSVANKVVAVVNGSPKAIGKQVGDAIADRRNRLAEDSFNAVPVKFDRAEAQKQLEDLIEFYWAAVPYDADKGGNAYKEARSRAEALLASRKITRNFRQVYGKDGLPKSSLDGFRESVLLGSGDQDSSKNLRIEKGESLSGVDLLKRWGKRPHNERFLSTTDVAAKPFEIYLGEQCESLRQAIEVLFLPIAERSETPGTLFYVDRLVQLIDDERKAANFREAFIKLLHEREVDRQPLPYYALLQADGDNMGKMIDNQKEQQQHGDLSKALSTFATRAKEIIKQHDGVPVYVGGDDMLAYLPLHTALDCVKELNKAFSQAMRNFAEDGRHPTLSVGLAIAHHLAPLSDVLDQVRSAEKKAKQVNGKNGLVISLRKRGSTERAIKGKLADLAGRMEQLIDLTLQKAISHGAAYELEELQRQMENSGLPEALEKETLRILKRKRESGGTKTVDEEKVLNVFKSWLPGLKDEKGTLRLDELAGEMVVAAELAKAYAMARISRKEATV